MIFKLPFFTSLFLVSIFLSDIPTSEQIRNTEFNTAINHRTEARRMDTFSGKSPKS